MRERKRERGGDESNVIFTSPTKLFAAVKMKFTTWLFETITMSTTGFCDDVQ